MRNEACQYIFVDYDNRNYAYFAKHCVTVLYITFETNLKIKSEYISM